MPELNEENVKALAHLCRLSLSQEELDRTKEDLKNILAYIDMLQEVDLTELPPYSLVDEQGIDSLRDDIPNNDLPRDLFLANSMGHIGGMISVPPVMTHPE